MVLFHSQMVLGLRAVPWSRSRPAQHEENREAALRQAFGEFLSTWADWNNRKVCGGAWQAEKGADQDRRGPPSQPSFLNPSQGRTLLQRSGQPRKHLVSTCCMPGPVLRPEERNEQDTGPIFTPPQSFIYSLIHSCIH